LAPKEREQPSSAFDNFVLDVPKRYAHDVAIDLMQEMEAEGMPWGIILPFEGDGADLLCTRCSALEELGMAVVMARHRYSSITFGRVFDLECFEWALNACGFAVRRHQRFAARSSEVAERLRAAIRRCRYVYEIGGRTDVYYARDSLEYACDEAAKKARSA
jgi:hypothetical protein